MSEPNTSTASSLAGLRTDYRELMQQLQSRQNTLRSKFTQNETRTSPKRSRRLEHTLQSPGAKRMKIFESRKTLASRSKQAHRSANQKTSTPYKRNDHSSMRVTENKCRVPSHPKPDSTGTKRKSRDETSFSHSKMIEENDDLFIDSANRRPKRPFPTPLRTDNASNRSLTQQQQQSILRRRRSPIQKITSESCTPLQESEKENIGGPRMSLRLSRSPHFHSDALRLDYHNEMMKRRRLSNDVGNDSYTAQLDHTGNNRPKPVQVTDVAQGPKSILSRKTRRVQTPNRVSFRLQDTTPNHSLLDQSGRVQPLLGYDWIAGLLDAEDTISERSDAFFDELKDFRRVNKEDCVYRQTDDRSSVVIPGLPTATITHPTDTHQCLHNFTLNDRLFVVPVHSNQDGESTCPICHESRTAEVRRGSPSYIRVSIPRSTLRSPYKLRPHRRCSFDATDTFGLSQHCLAGWQNSRPSMLPMATTIDLKEALRPQTLKEGTIGNESLYKSSKRLPLVPTERTQRLLNRSRSIQEQLNRMKNKHAQ